MAVQTAGSPRAMTRAYSELAGAVVALQELASRPIGRKPGPKPS